MMNFFLSIFVIFFSGFLPGLIWWVFIYSEGKRVFWPAIFGLSLLHNFLKIYALSLLGLYTYPVVLFILILEVFCLLFLLWRYNWFSSIKKYFYLEKKEIFIILVFLLLGAKRIAGAVFYPFVIGDVWWSWNKWAFQWFTRDSFSFDNEFTYPQLIPVNWSYLYTLVGSVYPGEYLAGVISVLFSLFILWILVCWGNKFSSMAGFIFALYFLFNQSSFFNYDIGSGLVDTPIAFFIILSLWFFYKYFNNRHRKNLYFSFLFAAASALTKQAGVFYFLLLILIFFAVRVKDGNLKAILRDVYKPCILSFGLMLFWYGVQRFSQVATWPNIQNALEGRNVFERVQISFYIWTQNLGIYLNVHEQSFWLIFLIMVIVFVLGFFGVFKSLKSIVFYRYIFIFFIIPYSLGWIFLYSYDIRNFIPALIFITFISIQGWVIFLYEKIMSIKNINDFLSKYNKKFILVLSGVFILWLALLSWNQDVLYRYKEHIFNVNDFRNDIIYKKGRLLLNNNLTGSLVSQWGYEWKDLVLKDEVMIITNDVTVVAKLHLSNIAEICDEGVSFTKCMDLKEKYFNNGTVLLWRGGYDKKDNIESYFKNNKNVDITLLHSDNIWSVWRVEK